ncbi:PLP-dependent aminotransferase family protein [Undibacterium sp. SXout7W]|uniref:aminotransferase-like domain-containing protein n=1 Tax=Undibacterium sp. SXout7W TaxID=3413049 RepID=UPI003BF0916A
MKRYEILAEDIAQAIRSNVLKYGDRLPSVRQTSSSRGVSASTVFQAYYLLEAWGLIRARERSGYYVINSSHHLPPEPEMHVNSSPDSISINVSDLIFNILESVRKREVVPLGSAFPSPMLYPFDKLARSISSSIQHIDPWSTVDDLTPGNSNLRRQIALRYLAEGMHIHTDDIIITNGALDALNLCLFAVARPGDAVIVETPTFYGALQALERMGVKAIEVSTHPREGIDLKALKEALDRHHPKACWLMTNFQNPLGSLMSEAKKRDLVALLTEYDVPLIEDDVYGELYFGTKKPLPAKAFDTNGIVMHCSSFSKSLAPGYRIGWAIPGRYTQSVARQKITSTLSAPIPLQEGLANYLSKGGYDRHLRQLRHRLSVHQTNVMNAIGKYFPKGTLATRPEGGYFLWLELPHQVNTLQLHQQALSLGISIAPGSMFSANQKYSHCLRINYGHPDEKRSEDSLRILGQLCHTQNLTY